MHLLKKLLYVLKQSLRKWYKRLDMFILRHYYFKSDYDCCVYFMKILDGSFMYLLLCIDDMLITFKNIFEINSLKDRLSVEFEIKDLGIARMILGIEICIDQSTGKLYLSNKKYFKKIFEHFLYTRLQASKYSIYS